MIVPIWDASVTSAPNAAAIEAAVTGELNVLAATYSNNVTVNLHVGWGETNGGAIDPSEAASAALGSFGFQFVQFSKVAAALAGRPVNIGSVNTSGWDLVTLTSANAVVLGLTANQPVDAYVGFSNQLGWDFSAGPTVGAGLYDFADAVAHEVTHVLGRFTQTSVAFPWLLDFYRYSAPGAQDQTHRALAPYFSTDGGETNLLPFDSKGDAADWAASVVGDAFGRAFVGQKAAVSATDIATMTALGWNLTSAKDFTPIIRADYNVYLNRDPSAAEIAVWQHLLSTGADKLGDLRTALLADPAGRASTSAEITSIYDTFFGRDPNAAEIAVWQNLIAAGAGYTSVQAAVIADPVGAAGATHAITSVYDAFFGRDPTASELSVWKGLLSAGDDLGDLRSAVFHSGEAAQRWSPALYDGYSTYLGRTPNTDEVTYWQAFFQRTGDDFATFHSTLINDPSGQAHIATVVTALYDRFMGRDPTAAEIGVWHGLILGGASYANVQTALVSDAAGRAYAATAITGLYETYFGRDPTSAELTTWTNLMAAGHDLADVRSGLLSSAADPTHSPFAINSLYEEYFGRGAAASELSVWQNLLASGHTLFQLQDTLERESTASSVQHIVTSNDGRQHAITFSGLNMTINGPQAYYDQISLSTAQFGAIDPLDAIHARQLNALDGTTEVIVSLDPTHSVLFENTWLYQLGYSTFVFH